MPHFENGTMGENAVNGERAKSQFLDVSFVGTKSY
jgi:hypothetical protein